MIQRIPRWGRVFGWGPAAGLCVTGAVVGLVLFLRPGQPRNDSRPIDSDVPAAATVTPQGGSFDIGGLALSVPPAAFDRDCRITVRKSRADHPPLDRNIRFASSVFAIETDGAPFSKDLEVGIPYDAGTLPSHASESHLTPAYWTGSDWVAAERYRVDAPNDRVVVRTSHFSEWAVTYFGSPAIEVAAAADAPFAINLVDDYRGRIAPGFVKALAEYLAEAYRRLCGKDGLDFRAPPLDPAKKLEVIVTDLGPRGGGNAPSDALLRIHYDLDPSTQLKAVVFHEFFHCVQWAHEMENVRDQPDVDLRRLAMNLFWLNEATAEWVAEKLVPGSQRVVFPDFCFEELFLNATVEIWADPNWKGRKDHEYASVLFVLYLTSRFGDAVVRDLVTGAFRTANHSEPLLDAVLRTRGSSLNREYAGFVLEHVYRKSFVSDPERWRMGPRDTLNLPSDSRVVGRPVDEDHPVEETFPGGAYQVPKAFRLSPGSSLGDLHLALEGDATWMHVFARPKTGEDFRYVGGHARGMRISLADVSEVVVVPVSFQRQNLIMTARVPKKEIKAYRLADIRVARSYRRWGYWEKGQAIGEGTVTYGAGVRSFELGWDHPWGENGHNRGVAQVKLAGLPPTVEPGSKVSLSATVKTDWRIAGYMEIASPSLAVGGDAGKGGWECTDDPFEEGYWAKQDDKGKWQTGTWTKSASLEVSNTVGVPAQSKSFQIHVHVRLDQNGSDHHGEMNVTFTYERE